MFISENRRRKMRNAINCLGTSPSPWPRAPSSVATATGEGPGRCSAHAQSRPKGQFVFQRQQMSVAQMLQEH